MTAYKIYNQDHDGEMETGGGGGHREQTTISISAWGLLVYSVIE